MSVTSVLILLWQTTSLRALGAGTFGWNKDAFSSRECKVERQPIVEFWHLNGLQYLFFSQRVTWEEGRMLCLNYNARLAILDNMEKAVSVARSIADSNIEMVDSWIGGRRIDFAWSWIDTDAGTDRKTEIPMEPNVEDFPPWTREPTRPTKECLAVDRRSHDHPNFIDLDCRLQRPFICEKKSEEVIGSPVPSKWIQVRRNTYTLYHARVTWHEAATFCRAQGTRLAVLKTSTVINILTNSMTKTRPDFETVWIGAHFSYGQWIWMATGSLLSPLTAENGYPPWRFGRPEKNDGCLLLDRHIEDTTNFIEATCDRKRDFVCEEYPEDEDEDWLQEPAKFAHENSTYIIYPIDKTWSDGRSFCTERGSVLAHISNIDTLNLIIEAMGDHPREIRHVWLGGKFRGKTGEWHWIDNDEKIPSQKDEVGFPPWARIDTGLDHDPESSTCLNLDRTDHVKPHFYGLDCASKQPFVCKITCEIPPAVGHGSWKCYDIKDGRECSLQCDEGLIMMGVRNVTCTFFAGWLTGQHWLEFPICLEPKEYTSRMIRAVSHDIQKSAGYYIVLDHLEPIMRSLSLKLAERLIKAFPVSRDLKMGMTCFATVPPSHIAFNQTDNCEVLNSLNLIQTKISNVSIERKSDISSFYNDVSMFKGRRILIIVIVDSTRASMYADAIDQFKSSGHHVTVIGLAEDWKMLLPLSTVGFDRRSNLFLFDEIELEKIIGQLDGRAQKPSKCKNIAALITQPLMSIQKKMKLLMKSVKAMKQSDMAELFCVGEINGRIMGISPSTPFPSAPLVPSFPSSIPPQPPNSETAEGEVANNSEELTARGLDLQPGTNRRGSNKSLLLPGTLQSTHIAQSVPDTSGTAEQKMNSEEQTKVSAESEPEQASISSATSNGPTVAKNEEALPRIYSEQTAKRELASTSQEQTVVTKDSSGEATENLQEQEKIGIPPSATTAPAEHPPEDAVSPNDGNEDAK